MNSVTRQNDRSKTSDDRSLTDLNLLESLPITFLLHTARH